MSNKLMEQLQEVIKKNLPEATAGAMLEKISKADADADALEDLKEKHETLINNHGKEMDALARGQEKNIATAKQASKDATDQLADYVEKNEDLKTKECRLLEQESSLSGRDKKLSIDEGLIDLREKHAEARVAEIKEINAELTAALQPAKS